LDAVEERKISTLAGNRTLDGPVCVLATTLIEICREFNSEQWGCFENVIQKSQFKIGLQTTCPAYINNGPFCTNIPCLNFVEKAGDCF
jgi:hypothetical protein